DGPIGRPGSLQASRSHEFDVQFSSFAYLCIVRKVHNAIKQTNNSKHKALHDAVSLYSTLPGDDSRTMLERCDDATQPDPLESVAKKLASRSEEHTSELQSRENIVCRLLLVKKKDRVLTRSGLLLG